MKIRWNTVAYYVTGLMAFTGIFLLGSCAAPPPAHSDGPPKEFFDVIYQKVPDGRTVMCLYREGRLGGYTNGPTPTMSCDWQNAIVHK